MMMPLPGDQRRSAEWDQAGKILLKLKKATNEKFLFVVVLMLLQSVAKLSIATGLAVRSNMSYYANIK